MEDVKFDAKSIAAWKILLDAEEDTLANDSSFVTNDNLLAIRVLGFFMNDFWNINIVTMIWAVISTIILSRSSFAAWAVLGSKGGDDAIPDLSNYIIFPLSNYFILFSACILGPSRLSNDAQESDYLSWWDLRLMVWFPANMKSVLDVSIGRPAEGVDVNIQVLHRGTGGIDVFCPLADGFVVHHSKHRRKCMIQINSITDADGRCSTLLPPRGSTGANEKGKDIQAGTYKMVFKPKSYFEKTGRKCFYPWVEVTKCTLHSN